MVLNPGKYHYRLNGNHDEPDKINLHRTEITNSNNEKLLGVLIDKELSFDVLIKSLRKKAVQKLGAPARISSYLTLDQKLLLSNSLVKPQFTYSL